MTPFAHRARLLAYAALLVPLLSAACGEVVAPITDECTRAWQPIALQNPDFDEGRIGWVEEPQDQPVIFEPDPADFQPDSAPFIARLGTDNMLVQTLAQEIELPAGTTMIRLHGQRCIESDEMDDAAAAKDEMTIELRDAATNTLLAEVARWDNRDGNALCQWSSFAEEQPLLTDAALARLSFHSVLDDLYITSFNVDTLALEVFTCAE